MVAAFSPSPTLPNLNTIAYQRLDRALGAGLRRQLFLAVCDRPQLQDRLSQSLHQQRQPEGSPLIQVTLDLEHPQFLGGMVQWCKQHHPETPPTFEVVGIEGLTRKSAAIQQRFLRHLRSGDRHWPLLQFNILLWLSPPWAHQIQQSVPEFWRWHTGLFIFQEESNFTPPVLPPQRETREQTIAVTPLPIPPTKEGEFPLVTVTGDEVIPTKRVKDQSSPIPINKEESSSSSLKNDGAPVPIAPQITLPHHLTLAEIEALQKSQPPGTVARAYLELGQQYRDRISQGQSSFENLTIAIQAYEGALQWEQNLANLPELFNDLGNFYWMRSRANSSQATIEIEQAIACYQTALNHLEDREQAPDLYATIQNNLGAGYGDLARHSNFVENLQQSILAYQEALRYRTRDRHPLKYGSTQNNLGTAYWHLAQKYDPITNLKAAINAYQEASQQYDTQKDPLNWAMIQNNLGTAYWNLSQYEEPQNYLKLAIKSYENSLKYRTAQTIPAACAATQNNLGTAYWHLSAREELEIDSRQEYLERAVGAYAIATQLAGELQLKTPPIPINFDFLATYNNLGLVHYQLGTEEQFFMKTELKMAHLEAAIQAHLQVLTATPPHTETYETTLNYIVRTIRACYQQGGINGQNRALSQVPGPLLPQLLPRL